MKLTPACMLVFSFCFGCWPVEGQSNSFGFNRIITGWTNYSTAFSMTHDADAAMGEFATVGTLYTPPIDVAPLEFAAIIIWFGGNGAAVDFENFTFRVMLWSGLDAFIREPRGSDLASYTFSQPAGGVTAVRDSTTRGGRAAYHVRFMLPNPTLTLTQCHTYVVGLCAIAASIRAGELFVPTAPFAGDSDAQAGNIVPFGWTYLLNSGGPTIYSGQLATELRVHPVGEVPRLRISQDHRSVTWPDAPCYELQTADQLTPTAWVPVTNTPPVACATSPDGPPRFFRLIRENPSRFVH